MEGFCEISFDDATDEDVQMLKTELSTIDGVEEAPKMRGMELATLNMGVMTAGAALGVVQTVAAMLKERKAKREAAESATSEAAEPAPGPTAKITLPNGTMIEVNGSMTNEQIQQLVSTLSG